MRELGDGVFGNEGALRLGAGKGEFWQFARQRCRAWWGQTLTFQLLTPPSLPAGPARTPRSTRAPREYLPLPWAPVMHPFLAPAPPP